MNEIRTEKQRLRAEALARRDALPAALRLRAATAMAERAASIGLSPGETVAGFWPIRTEPDVHPLMDALGKRGARLCLPVVIDRTTIVFRHYRLGDALVASGFGTMGPDAASPCLDPHLLLMPLAAFDRSGNRIGYGAGFYDRAIARLHGKGLRPRLIGIAFDCQEVEAIEAEPHDIRLDAVLTESGLRNFSGNGYRGHAISVSG